MLMEAREHLQSMPSIDFVWDEYSVLKEQLGEPKFEDDLVPSDHLSKVILVAKNLSCLVLEVALEDWPARCSV